MSSLDQPVGNYTTMSNDDILAWTRDLVTKYARRDAQCRLNDLAYHNRYGDILKQTTPQMEAARDSPILRDALLSTWNLMFPIVNTSVMQLARLPEIEVPAPVMGDDKSAVFAEKQERIHYALWDANSMTAKHGRIAWNLSCMGSSCQFVRPDPKKKLPAFLVRRPDTCYPVPLGEGEREFEFVIFRWMESLDTAARRYPDMASKFKVRGTLNKEVEVIEYIDANGYVHMVGEQRIRDVSHEWGFVPVTVTPAIDTGAIFGPSDIDQLIAINIYLNDLQAQLRSAIGESLFGVNFMRGGTEKPINNAPGAWTWIDADADPIRISAPAIPPQMFELVNQTEEFMRVHAVWPRAMSGQVESGFATGKAITSMQGVSGGIATIRQGYIGEDLKRTNKFAFQILEKSWPKQEYTLFAEAVHGPQSPPGRDTPFQVTFVPEQDVNHYYQNNLYYSMFGSDMNQAVVSGLQLKGEGVISTRFMRNQLPGIRDAEGMDDEVRAEKREDMEFEFELQSRLEQLKSDLAMKQMQAQAALQPPPPGGAGGEAPPSGVEPMGMPGAVPPTAPGAPTVLPEGQPVVMGEGAPLSGEANFPLPFKEVTPFNEALAAISGGGGAPAEAAPPPPETEMDSTADPNRFNIDDVVGAIAAVPKLKGEVYIIGELAERGTSTTIELGLTDMLDKQTIINALQQYYGKMKFHKVDSNKIPPGAVKVEQGSGNEQVANTQTLPKPQGVEEPGAIGAAGPTQPPGMPPEMGVA